MKQFKKIINNMEENGDLTATFIFNEVEELVKREKIKLLGELLCGESRSISKGEIELKLKKLSKK